LTTHEKYQKGDWASNLHVTDYIAEQGFIKQIRYFYQVLSHYKSNKDSCLLAAQGYAGQAARVPKNSLCGGRVSVIMGRKI